MLNLLLNVVIGLLVIGVTYYVAALLLPAPIPIIATLVVAIVVLIYITRGGKSPIV